MSEEPELTKSQRQAYFEIGLRESIARARGELPGELNPGWAEWAEGLLTARDEIAALRAENQRLRETLASVSPPVAFSDAHLTHVTRYGSGRVVWGVTASLAAPPEAR